MLNEIINYDNNWLNNYILNVAYDF
jgi:hypothetical protein